MIRHTKLKFSIRHILLSFLIVFSISSSASPSFKVDGIYYNIIKGNTCEVTNSTGGNAISTDQSITLADGEKKTLTIPSTVSYNNQIYTVVRIGMCAFQHCGDFTDIVIPSTVETIYYNAFDSNQTLESISLPSGVKQVYGQAFANCGNLKTINISSSVSYIASSAFLKSSSVESITIDSQNETYDSRDNCNAIIETPSNTLIFGCKSSTIPEGVVSIGDEAFYLCEGLTSAMFPSTLATIGESAFSGCTGLSSISISAKLTEIGEGAFDDCNNIQYIKVASGNPIYDSRNNCNALIETKSNTIILGCGNTVIPEGIVTIGEHAFTGCKVLDSITLPNTVKTIGYRAFYNSSIKYFDGGISVASISGYAFGFCSKLETVILPSTVTTIEDYAFYDCTSLTSITNYSSTPQTLTDLTFGTLAQGATLHVCTDCGVKYKAANIWKKFNIVEDIVSTDLILRDGEEYTETEKQTSLTIRYVRNYQNTKWQALYIPFSLSYDDWCQNFEVAYINAFHSYDTDGDGELDFVQLEVCKINKGYLKPNNPYLIRAKATGEQILTASNATLYPAVINTIDCSTVSNSFIFKGTYTAIDHLNQFGCFFMSGGDLCSTTNPDAVLSPYRWYMTTENRESPYSTTSFAKNLRFGILVLGDDGETTSIAPVALGSSNDSSIYDFSGRKVSTSEMRNLPKGIYVFNNHKFIKK